MIFHWLQDFLFFFLPKSSTYYFLKNPLFIFLEKIFLLFHFVNYTEKFSIKDINLRTFLLLQELHKRGAKCYVMKRNNLFLDNFKIKYQNKILRFEILPTFDFLSRFSFKIIDDKSLAKKYLKKGGFPVLEGRSFWFFQIKKALNYANKIGFPVVVKPTAGSQSLKVTTDIQNLKELKRAIFSVLEVSPRFMIEKYLKASLYRITIIDFDNIFCVKFIPANVIGDGKSTILELIQKKNSDLKRGNLKDKAFTLYKLVIDNTTEELLKEKGYKKDTVLKENEIFYLQKDPFLKLGADLEEVTPLMHKDNIELFKNVAKFFDCRLLGIDFLAQDIALSFKKQNCAIIDLNSMPCIELHHFPSLGTPTNPAKALADAVFKYYLL